MEIRRLELLVTDQDLQDLARQHIPAEVAFENLEILIVDNGVRVKGVYQVFVPVSFEAFWELGIDRGHATARLASFRTMGMPANVLKSFIMNVVADAAKKAPWLLVEGDTVRVNVDQWLKADGVDVQSHLTAIRCQPSQLILEGGLLESRL